MVTEVPEQMGFDEAATITDCVTVDVTLIVIVFDVAVVGLAHAALDVMTTRTWSPFMSAPSVYVALLVPTLSPFFFHWYDGVEPPFVGVAVKLTEVPEQIGFSLATILTDGLTVEVTLMVMVLDVAVVGFAHAALEVITT